MSAALRPLAAALLVALLGLCGPSGAAAAVLPSGFQDTEVFTGLNEPTKLRFAPDGRAFIALRKGKIVVYDSVADESPTLFADLSENVYDSGDRGILGMALDPEFDTRPYVYVLYTYNHLLGDVAPPPKWVGPNPEGDPCPKPEGAEVDACPVSGRLVRLTAEGSGAKEDSNGDPLEEPLVEDWCQQFSSHSIGDLQFDSEGALYASAGEGASFESPDYGQFGWPNENQCGDPPGSVGEELVVPTAEGGSLRAQNPENLDGSVIRVDPDTGEGLPGNPLFASLDQNERRVVAQGFRNPFRFAIDPDSHEVYVANVGWYKYEELDRFEPPVGATPGILYNSGWPCYEGPGKTPGFDTLGLDVCEDLYATPGSTSQPFYSYQHGFPLTPGDPCETIYGSVINGISFYEGVPGGFPASYDGALFFADGARQCVYVMLPGEDGRPDPSTVTPFLTYGGIYPTAVDLEQGPDGALYYVNLLGPGFDSNGGVVHRISYAAGNQPPIAVLSADKESGPAPLTVHFDASGSSDADFGEELSFEWDLEGDGTFAAGAATAETTFFDDADHTVAVRVEDEQGASDVAELVVHSDDTPPQPEIVAPVAGTEWHVGQSIEFEGAATDDEDGTIPPSGLDWSTRIQHCPLACHVHPLQEFIDVAAGTLSAPEHDYPAQIEITLTATDSRGLSASATLKLSPEGSELRLASAPTGIALSAGQVSEAAPFAVTLIKGSHVTLSAPTTAFVGGQEYAWQSWSDGGQRVHTVDADGAAQHTAIYAPVPGPGDSGGGGQAISEPPVTRPETRILKHPPKRTRRRSARFVFAADQGDAWFQCLLDRGVYRTCRSARLFKHLRPGAHSLTIRALTPGGKEDLTPVAFRWKVLPPRPRG